ncbi:MAG: hypothetical protein FWH26_07850 [Oscillospiraceae bacterium]|nr:hypothetical protein [Oscillospiraceae bacterium]
MKAKKAVATLLCALLIIPIRASSSSAYALTNISGTTTGISIADGSSTAVCSVTGFQKYVTGCSIEACLQQYENGEWNTITTWQKSFDCYRGSLTGTVEITRGYDYRIQATYTATSEATTETFTITSGVKHY